MKLTQKTMLMQTSAKRTNTILIYSLIYQKQLKFSGMKDGYVVSTKRRSCLSSTPTGKTLLG